MLAGIGKITEALKENIMLKEKLSKLGYPLESSPAPLSIGQNEPTTNNFNNKKTEETDDETSQKNLKYFVTPQERQFLNNFYSTFSYISPRSLAKVLSGGISRSSPTYQEVLKNISRLDVKDIDYYRNLYWKSARALGRVQAGSADFVGALGILDKKNKARAKSKLAGPSTNQIAQIKKFKRPKNKK